MSSKSDFNPNETVYKRSDEIKKIVMEQKSVVATLHSNFSLGRINLIGRGQECQIVLEDGLVSRRHASITRNGDGTYLIVDTGSTNKTYVNNNPLRKDEKKQLAVGDVIKIGKTHLQLQSGGNLRVIKVD